MNNGVKLSFSRMFSAKNPFAHCAWPLFVYCAALVVIDDDVQFFIHARIYAHFILTQTLCL